MANPTLVDRFKPGSIVAGAWPMERFDRCANSGVFVFGKLRIVEGIEGHGDKAVVDPLELWYCTDRGEEIPVWFLPDVDVSMIDPDLIIGQKGRNVRDLLESCLPMSGLPMGAEPTMETGLAIFLSAFSRGCQFIMNDACIISGIINKNKHAVDTIMEKFPIDIDALRRDTRTAFRDCQPHGAEGMGRASRIITRASRKFRIN